MSRFDNLTEDELELILRIDMIDDDMRALIEKHWPWLLPRVVPKQLN